MRLKERRYSRIPARFLRVTARLPAKTLRPQPARLKAKEGGAAGLFRPAATHKRPKAGRPGRGRMILRCL